MEGNGDDDLAMFLENQRKLEEESKTPGEFNEGNQFADDTDAINLNPTKKVRAPPRRKDNSNLKDIVQS